jgi:hypothetical protein
VYNGRHHELSDTPLCHCNLEIRESHLSSSLKEKIASFLPLKKACAWPEKFDPTRLVFAAFDVSTYYVTLSHRLGALTAIAMAIVSRYCFVVDPVGEGA